MPESVKNFGTLLLALLEYNVTLTLLALLLAFPAGCLLALARISRYRLIYYPATVYVNLLRSLPLLMVMFWIYYTAPMLVDLRVDAYWAALIGLTVFEAAYFAEFMRTGLQSVSTEQRHAGLATGLKPWQVTLYIIWPQALRRVMPSLLSQSIIAFQDSTLASAIGVREVLRRTSIINAQQVQPVWLYSMLASIYFGSCFFLSLLVRRMERRMAGKQAV